MITRIRYTKQDNTLVSNEMIMGSDLVKATITETTHSITDSSGKLLYHGEHKNLAKAKKLLKDKLRGFGIPFGDEIRKRKIAIETNT